MKHLSGPGSSLSLYDSLIIIKEEILGFQIPMYNVVGMTIVHSTNKLLKETLGFGYIPRDTDE